MNAPAPIEVDLTQPQKQSPTAILANLVNLNALQGLLPFFAFGLSRGPLVLFGLIALGVCVLVAFSSLGWFFTTYWVENGHLVLQKGVLNRKRVQVPLDRIQQIATEQGIVQQIFGVRKVRVDSAGSAGSEIELSAITDDMVSQLRSQLVGTDQAGTAAPPTAQPFPGAVAPTPAGAPPTVAPPPGATTPETDLRTMVVRHSFADLAQIAVARPSPQVVAGIAALLSLGLGTSVERIFDSSVFGAAGAILLGVVALVLIVAVTIGGTIVREFDLTVWRSDQGLRLTAGLLNKREMFARTERVQYVKRKQNFLERRFNRTTVYLPQASATAGAEPGAASTGVFLVPGARDDKVDDLTDLFLAGDRPEPVHPIAAKARQRWFLWEGLVPGLLLLAVGIGLWIGDLTLAAIAVLIVAALITGWGYLLAKVSYANYAWNLNETAISRREGFLAHERIDVACRKLQSVKLRQGWWHRRHNLATVECGTAAGSFKIEHLPAATARQLRDELLYLVETNTQDWM